MESRKDQLQKQIIEAYKAKDKELYSLLKSQWAHRFGVESLEELEHLDLSISNQDSMVGETLKNNQSQNDFSGVNNETLIKDDGNKEKSMTNDTNKTVRTVDNGSQETNKIKSYEIPITQKIDKKNINPEKDYKGPPQVEVLIPLPPNPKYNYLKKWLLRS